MAPRIGGPGPPPTGYRARVSSGEVVLRVATPDDVDAVVALVQAAYRGEASRVGWTTEADLLDGQRTDATQVTAAVQDGAVLVAGADGALLACCEVRAAGAGTAYFGMFAVRPHLQATGIGRAVLAAAEEWARTELAAVRVEMTVITRRTELISWYVRRGYTRTGEARPFPHGDNRFGLPRRDDLEFCVLARKLGPEQDGRP